MANASSAEVNDSLSHKGKRVRAYSAAFKLDVLAYAQDNSNRAAARKFDVDERRVREWKKNKIEITALANRKNGKTRKRLDGAGPKPLSTELEEIILNWIHNRRSQGLRVSRKLIKKKAQITYRGMNGIEIAEADEFKASDGWLTRFMRRNGLSLRRKTSVAQKDPDRLIGKLVSYVLQVRRLSEKNNYAPSQIIAMDETPVWSDMVSETTIDSIGKKTITMKTTGHEKSRVSVCLAARADGTKLKPMVVFKGAKRETTAMNKEFRRHAVVASSANAWMNTELTHVWIESVLGSIAFARRLLAWDSFECHMEESVARSLKSKRIDVAIIPGGCTKYIQAPDVSWNKPFKAACTEKYDEWLATVRIHEETEAGNLKAPPRRTILKWIIDSWEELPTDLITKSFKSCALNLPTDGSADDTIHCFKEGEPCRQGREVLRSQQSILDEPDTNPFELTNSDIEDSSGPDL